MRCLGIAVLVGLMGILLGYFGQLLWEAAGHLAHM